MVDKVIYHTERKKILRPSSSRIHALDDTRILNFTKLSSNKQEKKPPEPKMEFSRLWIYLADSDLMLKETATNLLCEDFFLFLIKPKMLEIPVLETWSFLPGRLFLRPIHDNQII